MKIWLTIELSDTDTIDWAYKEIRKIINSIENLDVQYKLKITNMEKLKPEFKRADQLLEDKKE